MTETASRIFALVKAKKLTQKEFAERCGVSEKVVSQWKGESQSYKKYLPQIAGALEVTIGELMGTETSPAVDGRAGSDAMRMRSSVEWNWDDADSRFGYSDGSGGGALKSSAENRDATNNKQDYAERILHREDAFARLFNRLSAEQQTEILKRMLEMQEGK